MRAGHIGRPGSMHDRKMSMIIEGLQRSHRRMQAEKAVQIQNFLRPDSDGGTHGVVVLFAVRDDDVQPVGRAPLKQDNQLLFLEAAVVTSAITPRARKLGIAEVPTSASAPPFMKPLLVMGGWAMALS